MKYVGRILSVAAFCVLAGSQANSATETTTIAGTEQTTADNASNKQLALIAPAARNALVGMAQTPYFNSKYVVDQDILNVGLSFDSLGFLRFKKEDAFVCEYRPHLGQCELAKYAVYEQQPTAASQADVTLRLLKHEKYDHFEGTKNKQRCVGARAKVSPLGEGLARLLPRATADWQNISAISVEKLYRNHAATWLHVSDADALKNYIRCLRSGLAEYAIDIAAAERRFLPVLVLTIENDPLWETVEQEDLDFLYAYFNLTTFMNKQLRDLFGKARGTLIKSNGDTKIDINGSFMQSLIAEIEESNEYLIGKNLFVKIGAELWNKIGGTIPKVAANVIFFTVGYLLIVKYGFGQSIIAKYREVTGAVGNAGKISSPNVTKQVNVGEDCYLVEVTGNEKKNVLSALAARTAQ